MIVPLPQVLELGGSAWTVADDGKSLQRRVDATTAAAAVLAATPADRGSAELKEAWQKVYGRSPDPSDAWDHAIKAVEELLMPLVVPAQSKPNLGHVLGQLGQNPGGWKLRLQTSSTAVSSVGTLEALLRLIWPNPDRHGGAAAARKPSLEEAQAVVQIAVVVVQWARDGALAKK